MRTRTDMYQAVLPPAVITRIQAQEQAGWSVRQIVTFPASYEVETVIAKDVVQDVFVVYEQDIE